MTSPLNNCYYEILSHKLKGKILSYNWTHMIEQQKEKCKERKK